MRVTDIQSPKDIKSMNVRQLENLADQIRTFLIESIARTGGHLSSNLGVVELTLAMHYVFNAPKDKLIFDVGHQCYTHKILTGRAQMFPLLRQRNGLSGYQRMHESPYDCWEAGHSSTSLSAALGFATARDLLKQNYEVVALIGDGSLTGGMAMEALNDIGSKQKKLIIIFNDNNMSISRNHAGFEERITALRASKVYRSTKQGMKSNLKNNKMGQNVLKQVTKVKDHIKDGVIDAPLFREFNLDYIGPVDGHNLNELINVLETAKEHDGPIVVHVLTRKGKGYPYAEQDQTGKWHGVSPFDVKTGEPLMKLPYDHLTWSEVISRTLMRFAKKDKKLVVLTPAMAQGSKLLEFSKAYPDRFFDCGIAEQHTVTMAGAMALGGLHPFVSVYSTFLQRAYDQMNHDIGRMKLPVVIGIDRAGLVGQDGDTHQGVFDIAMLRSIPNLILSQPQDAAEAQNLLYTAFRSGKPFCIRYPRGNVKYEEVTDLQDIEIGSWTKTTVGTHPKSIVITYGPDVDHVIAKAKTNNMDLIVVNARFFKPVDGTMIDELYETGLPIHVFETDCRIGSLSTAILEYRNRVAPQFQTFGIDDHFVEQGSVRSLRIQEHIGLEDLFEELEQDV
ncbi:1-deoxy-D-xylulose-5-phosphate synthase [Catenisphaera adipataccumulans]|jgi:1-deoxy-D-xylulose-5-phosphate synthase|uniref:1-deoxy-D-xylulose-5-phosphate synthase n=1 Tax=Catenisphaera adipataccumulans TaxID=700500 RepID=A0A7W8CY30_9FIRM|nr:1-deoxy-D-xylulose-5-phosphate synthase [Catenisphaera adipataccumulans]MBB5183696.1 1-deoxy-D-xylulose-5-phosphate synthase [Catenisphaera adipataccumulans]